MSTASARRSAELDAREREVEYDRRLVALEARVALLERHQPALSEAAERFLCLMGDCAACRMAFPAGDFWRYLKLHDGEQNAGGELYAAAVACGARDARSLGKVFQRLMDRPADRVVLRRIGRDADGATWMICDSDSHSLS